MTRMQLPKKQVVHPLSCWDIISLQFLSMPYRWDLAILEKKKFQYDWQIDFPFLLKRRYHFFVVMDTSFGICCKSKKFDQLSNKISGSSSAPDFIESLKEILRRKPVQTTNITKAKFHSRYNVEIFSLSNLKGRLTHFFVLIKLETDR